MPRRVILAAALVAGAFAAAAAFVVASRDEPLCSRYAAPSGSDQNRGSADEPFRTVSRLAGSLRAGDTGCLLAGTYVEDVTVRAGGERDASITLRSAPAAVATLRGRLWITGGAHDIVVSGMRLDGRSASKLPSPTVHGDRIVFSGNDVTNHHAPAICFLIGSDRWGVAEDVVLERNRVHGCGALPPTNQHHGIYLASSRRARVVENVVFDNADRGIQLYPDAQGSIIERNVIDGNGQGVLFSGAGGTASSGNLVRANVITNSRIRFNVESSYPEGTAPGEGNVVSGNCIQGGELGSFSAEVGFTASRNVLADPGYADRGSGDFTVDPQGRCAGLGPSASPDPQ